MENLEIALGVWLVEEIEFNDDIYSENDGFNPDNMSEENE